MATSAEYVVQSLNSAGEGRVSVQLVSVVDPTEQGAYQQNLNLNLTAEEAQAYFPGSRFTLSLSPSKAK